MGQILISNLFVSLVDRWHFLKPHDFYVTTDEIVIKKPGLVTLLFSKVSKFGTTRPSFVPIIVTLIVDTSLVTRDPRVVVIVHHLR